MDAPVSDPGPEPGPVVVVETNNFREVIKHFDEDGNLNDNTRVLIDCAICQQKKLSILSTDPDEPHDEFEWEHFTVLRCGHALGIACAAEWFDRQGFQPTCPLCRTDVACDQGHNLLVNISGGRDPVEQPLQMKLLRRILDAPPCRHCPAKADDTGVEASLPAPGQQADALEDGASEAVDTVAEISQLAPVQETGTLEDGASEAVDTAAEISQSPPAQETGTLEDSTSEAVDTAAEISQPAPVQETDTLEDSASQATDTAAEISQPVSAQQTDSQERSASMQQRYSAPSTPQQSPVSRYNSKESPGRENEYPMTPQRLDPRVVRSFESWSGSSPSTPHYQAAISPSQPAYYYQRSPIMVYASPSTIPMVAHPMRPEEIAWYRGGNSPGFLVPRYSPMEPGALQPPIHGRAFPAFPGCSVPPPYYYHGGGPNQMAHHYPPYDAYYPY